MNDLLTRQKTFKGVNYDLGDSGAFPDRFLLDRVPHFVADSDCAKGSGHLDYLCDCTDRGIIKNFSHANHIIFMAFNDLVYCFALNQVVIPHYKKITTNITSKFSTIICALMAFLTNQTFNSAKFIHLDFNPFKVIRVFFSLASNKLRAIYKSPFSVSCVASVADHVNIIENLHDGNIICLDCTRYTFDLNNSVVSSVCHCLSFRPAPELVSVYTGYPNVYTGATLGLGRVA